MKSFATKSNEFFRKSWLIMDYMIWLIFSFKKFKKIDRSNIKKVLVIHLGAIGDIMITTPLVKAIKDNLGSEITYMLNRGKEVVFENNPNVKNIIFYNSNQNELINLLKEHKFDLAIIISPGVLKIKSITDICDSSEIKYKIGYFSSPRRGIGLNFNYRIFPISNKHTVIRNLSIIKKLGINVHNPELEYNISKNNIKSAKYKLRKFKLKENNYVVIHPGFGFMNNSEYPSRLWKIDNYSKVCDKLIEDFGVKILITGGDEEKILADKIKSFSINKDKIIISNGLFSFGELAYIISKSKVVITVGTSIVHLTCALKSKLIELVGKEDLNEWHPWQNESNFITLFHNDVCTGCNKLECRLKTTECLNTISPSEVIDAYKKLLENGKN